MPEQQENQTEVFHLKAPFKPTGDQPQAIEALVQGLKAVVILVIPLSQRDLIHALVAAAVKLFCQPHLTLLVFPALV